MAAQVLTDLANQVQANVDAEASAVAVLNGIATRIQTAVDAALANGASAAELAPVTAEVTARSRIRVTRFRPRSWPIRRLPLNHGFTLCCRAR